MDRHAYEERENYRTSFQLVFDDLLFFFAGMIHTQFVLYQPAGACVFTSSFVKFYWVESVVLSFKKRYSDREEELLEYYGMIDASVGGHPFVWLWVLAALRDSSSFVQ